MDKIVVSCIAILTAGTLYMIFSADTPIDKDLAYIEALKDALQSKDEVIKELIAMKQGITGNHLVLICFVCAGFGCFLAVLFFRYLERKEQIRANAMRQAVAHELYDMKGYIEYQQYDSGMIEI